MDSRVVCIGFDSSRLNAEELNKLALFLKGQPDILQVQLFPNFDATSDERMPSGMNVIVSSSAKVDTALISDELFQKFAVSKVYPLNDQKLTDETFTVRAEEINDAVCQFPVRPISGLVHNRHDNTELSAWAPELGGNGSFVGVYSQLGEDHRTKDYFVAARGTAPLYVRDLKNKVSAAGGNVTYGDLIYSKDWANFMGAAEGAAERNVQRNICNVAEACGVQVMRADDILNGAPHQDMNLAYPERAVPEWEQPTTAIRSIQFERKPAVLLTYGVVPIDACYALEHNKFFVVANPYDGIAAFTLTNREQMSQHLGLPADTGRAKTPESISTDVNEYKTRTHGMLWEYANSETQLVGAAHHVDLHKDAFRKLDKSFKKSMRGFGWNPDEEFQMERMVCVVAKIFNPYIRRKE